MIADIVRADRGAIWGRAEELQRRDPGLADAAALFGAVLDYEAGLVHRAELRIIEAARTNPAGMFK